ncbi:TetR/AcrR family transcriptional regulator [Cytophagaceae bacterium DM2B3-1]|uniref:TetR/AcrR family transcriptional regulator n=1 Tax=Xanthocytophaga flava TaxID=3048013 RepID=A0AAE3QWH9_9BACT|nr:TetR/AcrR family transcriptional regulator [Xanthocytophaga flavus]MDJ1471362.1 TetR/AcrR family transcriptional regulator [Xanthocytophaga flavus]MDJ1484775.1 TetR/AcrR family transcriptional regulator [Xanthocytophaga flavus]MDJ1496760.1 TetR/AcrR family transcriptional regulator [Xanthocytophaga flavus]
MRTRDENKESIVKVKALEMLVNEGFDGFSMQKLAKAAGVSPATLYIYYKDKDDLIVKLGIEEGKKMIAATFESFSPEMPFAEGLRVQWYNRVRYCMEQGISTCFFEQAKHSPYRDKITASIVEDFKEVMGKFIQNAIQNRELVSVPVEVFWSIAFAPLYNLIRFHQTGKNMGNRDFSLTDDYIEQTLTLVIKALKP